MGKRKKGHTRNIRLNEEAIDALKEQRARFRQKFGRDPGPGDLVFFDPDAEEPRPIDTDKVETEMLSAMEAAEIDPALIHAYRRTGMLVTEANRDQWSQEDLAEWYAALDEYEELWKIRN